MKLTIPQSEEVAELAARKIRGIYFYHSWPDPPDISPGIVNAIVESINEVCPPNQVAATDAQTICSVCGGEDLDYVEYYVCKECGN